MINLLDGLFDVSKILGETCENFRKDEKKELFKYLSPDLQNSYNSHTTSSATFTTGNDQSSLEPKKPDESNKDSSSKSITDMPSYLFKDETNNYIKVDS